MPKLKDGSVVNSYFTMRSPQNKDDLIKEGMTLLLGQIEKVHYIDDKTNISKEHVEYDVVVRSVNGSQTTIKNVKTMAGFFSANDFDEVVLEANDHAFKGKLDFSNSFNNKSGTMVVVASFYGNKNKPFILGAIPHPKKKGAKKADGIRRKGEFRGFRYEIDSKGNVTLIATGSKTPDGKEDNTDVTFSFIHKKGAIFTIDKDGSIKLIGSDGGYIFLNSKSGEASVVNTSGNLLSLTKDAITASTADGGKVLNLGENLQLTSDKDIVASSSGGVIVDAGAVTLKDLLAKIKIENGKIALGTPAAEVLDLFDQTLSQFSKLVQNLSTLPLGISTLPGTPIAPNPGLVAQLAVMNVQLTLIQTLLATIKGSV